MFTITDGIKTLVEGHQISKDQMSDVMRDIMSGNAHHAQIGSFLTALRMKGETPDVIAGAALIMREFANAIDPKCKGRLVDTCGTGGDQCNTFNISTISAIVAAGAGVIIAKHGNRSVSSSCGSADLLEAFGVNIALEPKKVEEVIENIGIGFMFAPSFHPAMKHAMPVRKALGLRTIFNILGPLSNPASARAHILGVFDKDLVPVMTESMAALGAEHAYIVHSEPGIDEIVPVSRTYLGIIKDGKVSYDEMNPEDFHMDPVNISDIEGGSPEDNLKIAVDILNGTDKGIHRHIVLVNSAYAILASGIVDSLTEAFKAAEESIDSGKAKEKLQDLVAETGGSKDSFEEAFK